MGDYWDRYGRRSSPCHRWPPRLKLLSTLALIAAAVTVPVEYWPVQGVLACLVFAAHSLARIPIAYLFRRLAVFLPMLFLLSVSVPASQGFRAGWDIMVAVMIRGTLAFGAALWLINVMPFEQLLATLRKLKVSDVLIAILAFMYRYFFVLCDERDKMVRARRARTLGRAGTGTRWRTSASLIAMLLIRAMGRAERVHGAMCARGWDGRVRTLEE
ncbi:MAG TPA: cobalt ECF transporter T component CbiQ [Planctomycetaceae bacterium]|nr:cobalt ECF transporter T component CbiQ [Planctomycetaceae bacterium]